MTLSGLSWLLCCSRRGPRQAVPDDLKQPDGRGEFDVGPACIQRDDADALARRRHDHVWLGRPCPMARARSYSGCAGSRRGQRRQLKMLNYGSDPPPIQVSGPRPHSKLEPVPKKSVSDRATPPVPAHLAGALAGPWSLPHVLTPESRWRGSASPALTLTGLAGGCSQPRRPVGRVSGSRRPGWPPWRMCWSEARMPRPPC